jgi:hypothetical protein
MIPARSSRFAVAFRNSIFSRPHDAPWRTGKTVEPIAKENSGYGHDLGFVAKKMGQSAD